MLRQAFRAAPSKQGAALEVQALHVLKHLGQVQPSASSC